MGLGLMLAPVVLDYGSVAAILHDVAMGLLVCVATLAALERPRARFALAAPGIWLVAVAPAASGRLVTGVHLLAGTLLLVLAPIPGSRPASGPLPPVTRSDRARASVT